MSVLSDRCICALEAAVTSACVEASNSSSPHQLWTHVLAIVYPAIQAHARQQASRFNPITRMPDELLIETFSRLPLWDRVRGATVCHQWRAVSLGAAAALWADIPNVRNMATYSSLLARAGPHPVSLEYAPKDTSSVRAFCAVLSSSLHRIKALRIGLPIGDREFIGDARYLIDALAGDAPLLESLCIHDPEDILLKADPSFRVLGSPALHTIELDPYSLSRLKRCAGSPTLRSLKISTPVIYDSLRRVDWNQLASLPVLEWLALHLTWVDEIAVSARFSPLPASLQHLHVELRGSCLSQLVCLYDLSRFQTLHIRFLGDAPDSRRLATIMPVLPDKTVVASIHVVRHACALMATDVRGRRRVLENLLFDAHWDTLLPNATRLWVDIHLQERSAPESAAALPELQELVLDSTSALSHSSILAWPPLECPRLETVRLLSEHARPALPAGEVVDYLRRLLGARPRLDSLVLDGIALKPAPDVALQAVATHVATTRSDALWPESYRVWSNSWGKLSYI